MKKAALFLVLLGVLGFGMGTWLQPRLPRAAGGRDSDNVFKILLGEGRRMFANHFAVKADVYMHSGFYPSIFDQAAAPKEGEEPGHEEAHDHAAEATNQPGHVHTEECEHNHAEDATTSGGHKCDTSFMGEPRDWIEKLGRHFMVTEHKHLEGGREREILPWLKLSAQLDPQRIETYTVTGYWLSERLNKPKEAEEFLREGLRANPQSHEILFDLGRIYKYHFKQPDRARSVWLLALRRWDEVEGVKEKPDKNSRNSILGQLAELELEQGNPLEAIRYFEEAKKYSPTPAALDERIGEIWLKLTLPTPGTPSPTH